ARADARGGADDPGERGGCRVAGRAAARGAVPRPRASRTAVGWAPALEARRSRRADPTRSGRDVAAGRGCSRRGGERARDAVRGAVGPGACRVPVARAPVAEAGAVRPVEPRALGACEPGVLPLHVADPALRRSRLPPGAATGARRVG